MPRRSRQADPEAIRTELLALLNNFEDELRIGTLRKKVVSLIPAHHLLRDLGSSLVDSALAASGIDRILYYLLAYPMTPICGEELMVVAGIGEWARRVRQLRVEFGWRIVSGVTFQETLSEELFGESQMPRLKPDEYMLIDNVQDRDAAHRWNVANQLRKTDQAVRDKLLQFFRCNVGAQITGEELRYVANDRTEWARRTRELRTELGWPIITRASGRPELPIGVYVLEADRQAPGHDRNIPDQERREVLRRDGYACVDCGWCHDKWNRSDPRHLEAHHVVQHASGGSNSRENLVTLCTVCHDKRHGDERAQN